MAHLAAPGVAARAELVLRELDRQIETLGESIDVVLLDDQEILYDWLGISWSSGAREVHFLLFTNIASDQGFCAMWFDDRLKPVWDDAIEPGILAAKYNPKRIDKHEHVNRIDDEIISMIRRSRFVVADYTGNRGGVYFEAGFALGLNRPVIWTCRKNRLHRVHFDAAHYNFLTWDFDHLPAFQSALQFRIESILGPGSYEPPT